MENIILNNKLNWDALLKAEQRPALFPAAEELFWDDSHISQQMLEAHLNPDLDAASYRHKTIEQTVEWLVSYLKLKNGARILDLGCGPGLYCSRFYRHGLDVVGMDYSRNSIDFAQRYAADNRMDIRYIYQNYLTMDFECEFDAIFLIYCDFGALSDSDRDILLQKVYRALKP
jgi:2-polyprenyl-3-methyl-5-hydroxy-6-metoxy-1,4-benzoquinol methylase